MVTLAVGVAACALCTVALLWRLDAGPLPLPFLDRPLADAVARLVPDLDVRLGRTVLTRAGRGAAVEVTDVRLAGRDGTLLLTVPHLRVRPSFGALLRGRLVVARVDVADAAVALTRAANGSWTVGEGAGVPVEAFRGDGPRDATTAPLPRLAFTRTSVRIDDRRSGGAIVVSDADLVVSPRADGVEVSVAALLDLESDVPPVRGRFHLPVRAELAADVAEGGGIGEVRFALTGDAGTLAPAGDDGPPFALAGLATTGRYRPMLETLDLERFTAAIGTSRVDARGRARMGAAPTLALDGTVDALSLAGLTRLWPVDLGSAARAWIATSLRAGTLQRCRVRLGDPLPPPGTDEAVAAPIPIDPKAARTAGPTAAESAMAVDVGCEFSDVTADYLAPLDPIRTAAGSARLTAERLVVDVRSGAVGACRVDGGTFAMDLTVDPPWATIAADVSGATADVLAFVEKPPIAFVPPLGIVPQTVAGTSQVHADLRLPIATTVRPSDVELRAIAALTEAALPPLVAGIGLRDGTLDVTVDRGAVAIAGTAALTGVAFVRAPVQLAVTVAPGAGAHGVTFVLEGADLGARGSARVADDVLTSLVVERLRLAGSDVTGAVRRGADGTWNVALGGASLDLAQLVADDPFGADAGVTVTAPFVLTLDVASLRTVRDVELRGVRGTVAGRNGWLEAVDLDAGLVPSGTLATSLAAGSGPRQVSVTSDRAGQVLAAAAGLEQIVGGSLVLDATTDVRGPFTALEGTLLLRDFRIVHAPVLAKILGIASLDGIAALVQGEGLPISEARVPFRWDGSRLEVHDVRAVGAIGLTADGSFDRGAGTCEIRGNVIPAYSLNSALGKVPLLGRFLVGAKGDGVFGIDYRVSGRTADPSVRVNPLTSVAPTVLRAWFVEPFGRAVERMRPARGGR